MELNLASLASVRTFVEEFKKKNLPLNVLLNNAGVSSLFPYHNISQVSWIARNQRQRTVSRCKSGLILCDFEHFNNWRWITLVTSCSQTCSWINWKKVHHQESWISPRLRTPSVNSFEINIGINSWCRQNELGWSSFRKVLWWLDCVRSIEISQYPLYKGWI